MSKYLLVFSLIIISLVSVANEWVSPIDKKYKDQNPELFSKFDQARTLLNSWSGQREKLKRAEALLREILKEDKKYAPAYREFGRLYIMAGNIKNQKNKNEHLRYSEATIKKSLDLEPEYADSYVLLGHLYTITKRYGDAEKALNKAMEFGTEIPWLKLNWADLLKQQKKYSDAMKMYQQVLSDETSNGKAHASALNGVTLIHWLMKEYDKANEGYKAQLDYQPEDAWTWGNYSNFLLFAYDDVDGAIEKGRKAIQLMNFRMGRFTLGCALYTKWAMLKDNPAAADDAQKYFKEAWSIYPYPKMVIEQTKKYPYTKNTYIALSEWLTSKKQSDAGQ
jgi:tetratricopeptide (TPR) repeat protein